MSETTSSPRPQAAPRTLAPGLLSGARQALPLVLGYIPVGFAFGVLGAKVGLSAANVVFMSALVYAGSSQLIAAGLLAVGTPPATIIITTFIVNLRHLLMSASLAPHLKDMNRLQQALFSYGITDETFAVHSGRFQNPDSPISRAESFSLNVTAHGAWVLSSWLGVTTSTLIPDVRPVGLDFALPAMFIALLVMQTRTRLHVIIALGAGALSTGLFLSGMNQWNVIVATVAFAGLGAYLEGAWTNRHSS
ncbi:4-azaleucine resistance probable transporter AzlC [Paucidesulfovibrio gracilis DSM 16080]|jgi:4-azaleucine resistance transporter AzlC|uniref:4-azaleucine resistance probable transporter AzlC n=1 Tax=Paucidesulfovibrio gracilis DSM 16080 TaxID=1121449 RepID=A0A1T4XSN0_9BACT|nr:AzlC family ABC transporter permease [Paucidesulfovibrio gracilis]SKA92576.1 4-azaleucine resistance probable transporter AzlC [Paucidesulfovibrio gracilis DSM 16080]